MPIAKITGQGLAAIALSVALLWSCLIGERVIVRHAAAREARSMRELQQLQRNHPTVPVSTPAPPLSHRPRITVG
jgi:hypothetical protein